jgi:MraZ protein
MFRGQYLYAIDSKGRLSIPAKLRRQVSPESNDTFVVTRGTGLCIDVFPLDQWLRFEEKLQTLNNFNPSTARFTRMILQHATEDSLDSQSRILIPQALLSYAQIEKEVLVLGVLKKIELWNPKIYEQYLKESDETYEEIAAKVMAGNE